MVKSANDNATYHLAKLDGTRITVLVAGKRIKAFKKRCEPEPDPALEGSKSEASTVEACIEEVATGRDVEKEVAMDKVAARKQRPSMKLNKILRRSSH